MSTIFSPSACSWKPPNPWGKCLSHSKREKKGTIGGDEHQAGGAVKGAVLARRIASSWWRTSICSPLHFSKGCHASPLFRKNFLCNFHKELLWAAHQLTDLHGHLFIFSLGRMEVFHLPGVLLRSLIAQRESDWGRSIQFALVMRQLDRDTTAITFARRIVPRSN